MTSTLLTDPSFGVVPTVRPLQCDLAFQIERAFETDTGLAAEAGTGIGKTLAYASQAVEHLLKYPEAPGVVIATATKALQTQIVDVELPRLVEGAAARARAQGQDAGVVLERLTFAKKVGKGNHLCQKRLMRAAKHDKVLQKRLPLYEAFMDQTPGWFLDDCPEHIQLPEDEAWRFSVSHCNPDKCPYAENCAEGGYLAAKEAAASASILVTNHHMVVADLILNRRELPAVLPNAMSAVIIDEAHKFPDLLRQQLAVEFTDKVWREQASSYLAMRDTADAQSMPGELPYIAGVRNTCAAFLRDASDFAEGTSADYAASLSRALEGTVIVSGYADAPALRRAAGMLSETSDRGSYVRSLASYATMLKLHLDAITLFRDEAARTGRYVLVNEHDERQPSDPPVRTLVPLSISSAWEPYLTAHDAIPVYVSATLAVGRGADHAMRFKPFFDDIGGTLAGHPHRTFIAGSPFDYKKQAVIHLPQTIRHGIAAKEFSKVAVDSSLPLLLANEGHAFVLFTANSDLDGYERELGSRDYPYPILSSRSNEDVRKRGAALFKRTPNATLLGSKTFFEGIDVPGLQLSLVVVPKLPFERPTAITKAKEARYEPGARFESVALPAMLTHLRQMCGRLIRSIDDRGVIAILDERIVTKSYGRRVLDALGFETRRDQVGVATQYLANASVVRRRLAETARMTPGDFA